MEYKIMLTLTVGVPRTGVYFLSAKAIAMLVDGEDKKQAWAWYNFYQSYME